MPVARQPELAEGRAARPDAARGLHPSREDHALRPRAHSRAHRPRARLGGARRTSSATKAARRVHARVALRRSRQADAGVRALLDRARRARLDRHRARRARLRGEVLHRRRQLGSGRQQHPGLLHPGRDEVSRPRPRRQARAALRHAAGGHGARHLLGLRVADARDHPHADVGDVRSRHPAQLSDDAGLRRAHLPARQRRRASRTSSSSTGIPTAGTHSLVWDEAVKISGADSDFHRRDLWEAIEAGAYPEWELGLQIFTEEQAEGFTLRRPRRHEDRARRARAGRPGRPDGAEPQSRQLLRRDRAGGVLRRARRPRHRLLERSAAGRPHPFLRRHADLAAGRPELPRDPDQRADRAGAQQPARRHASPGDPSRPGRRTSPTRSAAAVRSRPARRASSRFRNRREERDHKVRGKAERFADHYTQATLFWNSQTRRREAAHHQRVPLRAVARADAGDSGADGVGPDERRAGARRSAWPPGSASARCRRRCRRC